MDTRSSTRRLQAWLGDAGPPRLVRMHELLVRKGVDSTPAPEEPCWSTARAHPDHHVQIQKRRTQHPRALSAKRRSLAVTTRHVDANLRGARADGRQVGDHAARLVDGTLTVYGWASAALGGAALRRTRLVIGSPPPTSRSATCIGVAHHRIEVCPCYADSSFTGMAQWICT